MRDPERIDAIIEELRAYWKAHPDHRLGQIVSNAWWYSDEASLDLFVVEDEPIRKGLASLTRMESS
jgi:hypothetical protein